MRAIALTLVVLLAGCGIDGAPIPPDGAVEAVAEQGSGLIGDVGGI